MASSASVGRRPSRPEIRRYSGAGQAERGVRLIPLRGGRRLGHGVLHRARLRRVLRHAILQTGPGAHAATTAASTEEKKPSPSADGPVSGSTACSGCGIRPATLPASFTTPAMSRAEPFGLPLA